MTERSLASAASVAGQSASTEKGSEYILTSDCTDLQSAHPYNIYCWRQSIYLSCYFRLLVDKHTLPLEYKLALKCTYQHYQYNMPPSKKRPAAHTSGSLQPWAARCYRLYSLVYSSSRFIRFTAVWGGGVEQESPELDNLVVYLRIGRGVMHLIAYYM